MLDIRLTKLKKESTSTVHTPYIQGLPGYEPLNPVSMAFILTAHASSKNQHQSQPQCCASRPLSILEKVLPPVAAVVVSASLLLPTSVSAFDGPLVFDHDQSLSGANFSNRKDLRGAIFSKSNCKGADFSGSDLTNSQLDDANVR